MASVTVSTHIFKTVNSLDLKLEVFLRTSTLGNFDRKAPVVFFIHGGGFVGFNREHVPAHVVQSCLLRGWPLISTDYRLLPQVKGIDAFEDVKDAYQFVRENMSAVLAGREISPEEEGPLENIILVGQSAGAYLAHLGGLYLEPRPSAILTYYGFANTNEPYFSKPPPGTPKQIPPERVQQYLQEPVNTSITPLFRVFNPDCLLSDLSRNPQYVRPEVNFDNPADRRMMVMAWLIQEDGMPFWFEGIDKPFDDIAWKDFPPLVIVHGDKDKVTPLEGSAKLVNIIGPTKPRLFISKGHDHAFDSSFYLGDEDLSAVESAWAVIEEIIRASP